MWLVQPVPPIISEAGYTPDQIDQARAASSQQTHHRPTAKHLGLDMEKVILTVQEHGNMICRFPSRHLDVGIQTVKSSDKPAARR